MATFDDAVKFIRSKEGLKNWSDSEIIDTIINCIDAFAFTYTTDAENKINGIVLARWESKEALHIIYIAGNMSFFMSFLKKNFPDCKKITGYRFDKLVEYPTENKLLNV